MTKAKKTLKTVKKTVKSSKKPVEKVIIPISKLDDTAKYVLLQRRYIQHLPPKTQIAYIYKQSNGESITIVSAFVQYHYIDKSGLGGMMIKCGNRTYGNLYESLEKVYIYKRDETKVGKQISENLARGEIYISEEELKIRIQRLESILASLATKLTKSTSSQQLVPPKPTKKSTKKEKRPTSLVHTREKPVLF